VLKKTLKIILGVALVPVCIAVSVAIYGQISRTAVTGETHNYFYTGMVAYLVVHTVLYKPLSIYVFGHEFVHALSAWVCGGKVKSFNVSSRSGSVATTKSNFLISLSPYFIPVYAVLLALIYFIGGLFVDMSRYSSFFTLIMGFAIAFHIVLTIEFLRNKQPDLAESGYIFSITLIYIVNIVVCALLFKLVFPEFSLKQFFVSSADTTRMIFLGLYRQLFVV
jgi:hypothetical protein